MSLAVKTYEGCSGYTLVLMELEDTIGKNLNDVDTALLIDRDAAHVGASSPDGP